MTSLAAYTLERQKEATRGVTETHTARRVPMPVYIVFTSVTGYRRSIRNKNSSTAQTYKTERLDKNYCDG